MRDKFYEYLVLFLTVALMGLALLVFPFSRRTAWLILTAGIPWTIELSEWESLTLSLPTDIFAVLTGSVTGVYLLFFPHHLRRIWHASITRWVVLYLLWMGIGVIFSADHVISLKFWISQSAYFLAFGIGSYLWLERRGSPTQLYLWVILPSAALVMSICVLEHLKMGGSRAVVDKAISPFMREHTVYGAYGAWFFTASVVAFFLRPGILTTAAVGISGTALVLSYSRGGWLSALGALSIWFAVEQLRRLSAITRFVLVSGVSIMLLIMGIFLISYNPEILQLYAKQQVGEIGEHLVSSFDVQQNASNMERINRWFSAIQMIQERPLLGFGANTFAQEYSAYQRSITRTKISVEMGEIGGAHSEYFTAASEMGIPGLVLLLGIYLSTIWFGMSYLWREGSASKRWEVALVLLPLLSYYLHGFINNFMDHGHMAALVYLHWGILAVLQRESVPSPHAATYQV
ncbi:MAG: O-antigen ligase family protein [Bacteroidia bacterium]|nr:O-antigen ligase family protein [Bacteroidia bacterium]MCX7651939.1 O-antigen ligase family protein [Bacteroidia bacterium]MDW8416090.1 O-antigen ligase family protein [Bacteroidia bacterium]